MRLYAYYALLFCCCVYLPLSTCITAVKRKPPTADPCYYDELYNVEDVPKCLQHVKEKAADSQLFWFGDNWSQRCAEATAQSWVSNMIEECTCWLPVTAAAAMWNEFRFAATIRRNSSAILVSAVDSCKCRLSTWSICATCSYFRK